MSAGTHPSHDGSLILPSDSDARRARRRRRTRRQRRAALLVAGVCALVLGEALAHVVAWWPSDRLKEPSISASAPPGSGAEVAVRGMDPVPVDVPFALDIPSAPALSDSNGRGAGGPSNGVAWVPASAMRSQGTLGGAGASSIKEAPAPSPGPVDSGAASNSAPLPGSGPVASAGNGPSGRLALAAGSSEARSPSAQGGASAAEALKRAAAEALARERNINKVRNYPDRPASHVGND
jgi:hypothetical protein